MMTTFAISHPTLNPFAWVSAKIETVKDRFALHREYLAGVKELDELSQRELEDIGVARCDISDIVRKHVYGA